VRLMNVAPAAIAAVSGDDLSFGESVR